MVKAVVFKVFFLKRILELQDLFQSKLLSFDFECIIRFRLSDYDIFLTQKKHFSIRLKISEKIVDWLAPFARTLFYSPTSA